MAFEPFGPLAKSRCVGFRWGPAEISRTLASMIGLVIVAHGRLADEFKAALEHIVGP